ncbi:MAG: SRPBCC domain-containing protein [Dehalococcoidia bacterium]
MNEVRLSVVLPLDQAAAFDLFTNRMSDWWPPDRKYTGPEATLHIEPSGRFWERGTDGAEVECGHVLDWSPPNRLVMDFYKGTDPDHPTRVTVSFVAESEGTRVAILHVPTAASLDLWESRAPLYVASWELCFTSLVAVA